MNVGVLEAILRLNDQLSGPLKGVAGTMDSVGKSLSSTGDKLTRRVTLPLVGIGAAAVKLAVDAEETANKFDVVMGPAAGRLRAEFDHLREFMSLTTFEMEAATAGLQDMLVPMGVSRDLAAELSLETLKLAGDIASFNNVATGDVLNAFKSALAGQSEPMRRFGVDTRASVLEVVALDAGLMRAGQEMSETARAQAVLIQATRQSADALGDQERTVNSTANQLKLLWTDIRDIGAAIGRDLVPVVRDVTAEAREWLKWFNDLDPSTRQLIVKVGLLSAALGPVLSVTGRLIGAGGSLVGVLVNVAKGAAGTAGEMGGLAVGVGRLLPMLIGPVGLAAGIGIVAAALISFVLKEGGIFENWIAGTKESIKELHGGMTNLRDSTAKLGLVLADQFRTTMPALTKAISEGVAAGKDMDDILSDLVLRFKEGTAEGDALRAAIAEINAERAAVRFAAREAEAAERALAAAQKAAAEAAEQQKEALNTLGFTTLPQVREKIATLNLAIASGQVPYAQLRAAVTDLKSEIEELGFKTPELEAALDRAAAAAARATGGIQGFLDRQPKVQSEIGSTNEFLKRNKDLFKDGAEAVSTHAARLNADYNLAVMDAQAQTEELRQAQLRAENSTLRWGTALTSVFDTIRAGKQWLDNLIGSVTNFIGSLLSGKGPLEAFQSALGGIGGLIGGVGGKAGGVLGNILGGGGFDKVLGLFGGGGGAAAAAGGAAALGGTAGAVSGLGASVAGALPGATVTISSAATTAGTTTGTAVGTGMLAGIKSSIASGASALWGAIGPLLTNPLTGIFAGAGVGVGFLVKALLGSDSKDFQAKFRKEYQPFLGAMSDELVRSMGDLANRLKDEGKGPIAFSLASLFTLPEAIKETGIRDLGAFEFAVERVREAFDRASKGEMELAEATKILEGVYPALEDAVGRFGDRGQFVMEHLDAFIRNEFIPTWGEIADAAQDSAEIANNAYQDALSEIDRAHQLLTSAVTDEEKMRAEEALKAAQRAANVWQQELDKVKGSASDTSDAVVRSLRGAADSINDTFGDLRPIEVPIQFHTLGSRQSFIEEFGLEGFARGSGGFRNFGAGTPVMLHGEERVQTRGQARSEDALLQEIRGLRVDLRRQQAVQTVTNRDRSLMGL